MQSIALLDILTWKREYVRHPAGAPGSQGGEFAPSTGAVGADQPRTAELTQVAHAISKTAGGTSLQNRAEMKRRVQADLTERLRKHPAFANMEPFPPLNADPVARWVQQAIDLWAETSGDSSLPAIRMQYAVKQEFGLKDAEMGHLEDAGFPSPEEEARNRAFVRAEYEATQEWFKSQGITHVSVSRGMGFDADEYGRGVEPGHHTVTMQPASSWTTDTDLAAEFARAQDVPIALTTRVPVADVLSTCVTGRGCLVEQELILLGKPIKATVYDWTDEDVEGEWTRKILESFR